MQFKLYSRQGFALLFFVYLLAWIPVLYAYFRLKSLGNRRSDDLHTAPPKYVLTAVLLIFALFCLFPLVYISYLIKSQQPKTKTPGKEPPWYNVLSRIKRWLNTKSLPDDPESVTNREAAYLFASMVAKVSLHAVVGFTVIGQSAVLDRHRLTKSPHKMPHRNITKVRNQPDNKNEDDETETNILLTSAGAFVGLFLLVWLIQRCTRPKKALKGDRRRAAWWVQLEVLHFVAAAVHLISAFAIFGSAIWDKNDPHLTLKRYSVRPDWDASHFIKPQGWDLRCFNLTTQRLSDFAAKCPSSLASVYSSKHRSRGGFLNIAVAAFVYAAWSGLCHLYAGQWLYRHRDKPFSVAVLRLTWIRWADYLVSAPTMLLTVNIIFAAANLSGIIASPLLLILTEALAFASEYNYLRANIDSTTALEMRLI